MEEVAKEFLKSRTAMGVRLGRSEDVGSPILAQPSQGSPQPFSIGPVVGREHPNPPMPRSVRDEKAFAVRGLLEYARCSRGKLGMIGKPETVASLETGLMSRRRRQMGTGIYDSTFSRPPGAFAVTAMMFWR